MLPSRRWSLGLVALAAAILVFVGLLHTPPVRAWLARTVTTALLDYGVALRVEDLRYNLLFLTLEARDVEVAASASPDRPFFRADRIRLDVPWRSVFRREAAVQSIEAVRPRVTIQRRHDGSFNLPVPPEADDPEAAAAPIESFGFERLLIEDLALEYADAVGDLSVEVDGFTLRLLPQEEAAATARASVGTMVVDRGVQLRLGDRLTAITELAGDIAFDGARLEVSGFRAEAPEAALTLAGRIDLLGSEPEVDLSFGGDVRLAEAAAWVIPDDPPGGLVRFSGRARGARADPGIELEISSRDLAWRDLSGVSLRTVVAANAAGAEVETLTLEGAGGTVRGRGVVRLATGGGVEDAEATLEWSGLDLMTLAAGLVEDPPVRLATQVDGSLTVSLAGTSLADLTAEMQLTSRGADAARGAVLSGQADLGLADGAWTFRHDHRLGSIRLRGANQGRLAADDLMASTLGGPLSITIDDFAAAAQTLQRAGLDVPVEAAGTLRGRASVEASLSGTARAPSLAIEAKAADVQAGGLGPGVVVASGRVTPSRVDLAALEADFGANRLSGNVGVDWETGRLGGSVVAQFLDLETLAAALPAEWRPSGSVAVEAVLSGTTEVPALEAVLDGDAIAVAGQHLDRVSAKLTLAGTDVAVDDAVLEQAAGRMSMSTRYDLATGRYLLDADISGWEIVPGVVPAQGTISGRLEGRGTVEDPSASARLTFADLAYGEYPVGTGTVDLDVGAGRLSLRAGLPDVSTSAGATVELAAPYPLLAIVEISRASVSRLAGVLPGDEGVSTAAALSGSLSVYGEVAGTLDNLEEAVADLQIELFDAAVGEIPVSLAGPARLRYRQEDLSAHGVDLQVGASRVSVDGRFGARAPDSALQIEANATVDDLIDLAAIAAPDLDVSGSGTVAIEAEARGPLTLPQVVSRVSASIDALGYGVHPPITNFSLEAGYEDGLFRLSSATASWQGASFSATAEVPAALLADYLPPAYLDALPSGPSSATLDARLDSVTRDALAPFVDEETLAGIDARLSGTLRVVADGLDASHVEGELVLDEADFAFARVPFGQVEPTRISWHRGRLEIDQLRWEGEGSRLEVTGGARAGDGRADLDVDVQGMFNLRMLSAFSPGTATDGTMRVQLSAGGTAAEPDLRGQVTLERVAVTVQEPRFAVTDLSGSIDIEGDRATASGLSGSANGGAITLGGHASFPGLALQDAELTVQGRRIAIAPASGAQMEVDADLTFVAAPDADPLLAGRITVLRGAYRSQISLADLALGGDGGAVQTAGLTEETLVDRIRLDVAVVTAGDVRIDNNYGQADLGATLRAIGTVGQPALTGRLTAREGGEVFLGGNTYVIEQGAVDFISPTAIEPDISLRARTQIGGHDITLNVAGTPDALTYDLQSDPPRPESDIVSLLVTGRTLSEAGAQTDAVARDQVLSYLSGDLLGFAGRAVGLDTVRLERGLSADTLPTDLALFAGDEDPASRLTISKYLRRDVEIVLSQNLRESGGLTWIAMYRPLPPVELRVVSRDDGSRAYEFRHTVQFGRGVRSGGAAGDDEQRPTVRVAAVQFEGDLGVEARALSAELDLESGDRFDFFAWQEDREALQAFYHERGYLEVRVDATRESAPSRAAADGEEAIILSYAIDRGPLTSLVVEGVDLPGDVRDSIRRSWAQVVFDGFLIEEAREIVRRHLVERGYVVPSIAVETVRPGEGEKQLRIAVEPGVRAGARTIEFAGNRAFEPARLREALAPADLDRLAWLEPESVAAALERFYRSEGFLSASVTVQSPIVEGTRARLPVEIEEGARFTLTNLAVSGAEALGEASVRTAADLPTGGPYLPAEADAARRRVEREYRRRGFNSVRTTATALVDPDAETVTLDLEIAEGLRQVLADVVVAGNETTRSDLVTEYLEFAAGQPVDLTEWYAARRRLYDTNVFRSVEIDVAQLESSGPAGSISSYGEQPVRASVVLEEWPRYRFRYGFQLNDEASPVGERARDFSPGFVADIQDRNVLGRAAQAGVAIRLQRDFRIARAFFSTPSFFGLRARSGVFVTRSRGYIEDPPLVPGGLPFDRIEDTTAVTLEQRFEVQSAVDVAFSYSLEGKHLFDPDPDPNDFFPLDNRFRVARLRGSFVAERRDDPFDARRGWFHSSTVEYGPEFLASQLHFITYLAQTYYFRPIGPEDRPTVFASAVRVGVGRGFGQDLISGEKFRAGGANTVRGYPEDGLGRRDFFGAPAGGNALLVFNQEVRFPVFRWIRGVTFLDAGNVFSRVAGLSVTDLEVGMGVGLRIQTPFALVRVDHATALSPATGEQANRWYFSIGQAF